MKPYFESQGITLYHADCREVLPTLAAGSADLVLTDPPYEEAAHTLQRRINRGRERGHVEKSKMTSEPLPFAPITEVVREEAAREMGRIAAGWVLAFCQVEAAMRWREVFEGAGLVYKRTCVWIKPDGMPQYSGDRPGMGYESIVAMHIPGRSEWNGGGRHGVFTENKQEIGGKASPHPTTKPTRLMARLIHLFSNPLRFPAGPPSLIVDPFAGSGSTLIAAHRTGRRAIGIELEERYCEIAAERIRKEQSQLDLFTSATP